MALEQELATYASHLGSWADHEGKFVLVQGERVMGFFERYEDALRAAYDGLGVDTPFLVKQVHAVEQVQFISRFLDAAPAP